MAECDVSTNTERSESSNEMRIEMDGNEVKKFTWREFTENTTFHGVKYVFEDTSWFRR